MALPFETARDDYVSLFAVASSAALIPIDTHIGRCRTDPSSNRNCCIRVVSGLTAFNAQSELPTPSLAEGRHSLRCPFVLTE